MKNFVGGRVNKKFPVVLTTPEIVIRDANDLSKIKWELIIIVSLVSRRHLYPFTNSNARTKAIV